MSEWLKEEVPVHRWFLVLVVIAVVVNFITTLLEADWLLAAAMVVVALATYLVIRVRSRANHDPVL